MLLFAFMHFSSCSLICRAQTAVQPTQPRTLAAALVVANRTLTALGGVQAWSQISSIQRTATITSSITATATTIWVDDWSSGTLKTSRTLSGSGGGNSPTSSAIVQRYNANGQSVVVPAQDESVIFATAIPSEALLLGIQSTQCIFYPEDSDLLDPNSIQNVPKGEIAFAEVCSGTNPRSGALHWRVNASTYMPISVSIPQLAFLSSSNVYTLVTFTSYTTVGSVSIPNQITLTDTSGVSRHIQFSSILPVQAAASSSK